MVTMPLTMLKLIDLIDNGLKYINQTKSRTEIKRLIKAGAVEIGGVKFTEPLEYILIRKDAIVRIGKKIFFKIGGL